MSLNLVLNTQTSGFHWDGVSLRQGHSLEDEFTCIDNMEEVGGGGGGGLSLHRRSVYMYSCMVDR